MFFIRQITELSRSCQSSLSTLVSPTCQVRCDGRSLLHCRHGAVDASGTFTDMIVQYDDVVVMTRTVATTTMYTNVVGVEPLSPGIPRPGGHRTSQKSNKLRVIQRPFVTVHAAVDVDLATTSVRCTVRVPRSDPTGINTTGERHTVIIGCDNRLGKNCLLHFTETRNSIGCITRTLRISSDQSSGGGTSTHKYPRTQL